MEKFICVMLITLLFVSCAHTPKMTEISIRPNNNKTKEIIKRPEPLPKPKQKENLELLFPVRGAYVSSEFGWRGNEYHKGVDLAAPLGTPIKACVDGKVLSSGRVKFLGGYGNAILIKHKNGIYTYYAHLNSVKVSQGNTVKRGDVIGTVGNTGKANGAHLHLELIIHYKNHNPVPYFVISNSVTDSAMLWLKGVKKSVETGLGLKKLIGD